MVEFANRSRAKSHLALAVSGRPDEEVELIVDTCVDEFRHRRLPRSPPGTMVMLISQLYWVIRDDDLKAFEAFWKSATVAASTNLLGGSVTGSAAIGLFSTFFGVYRQVKAKGATLTIDQCQVLVALRKAGRPIRVEELIQGVDFSTEELERILNSLTTVRCSDGTMVGVVARDAEDRWAPSGI